MLAVSTFTSGCISQRDPTGSTRLHTSEPAAAARKTAEINPQLLRLVQEHEAIRPPSRKPAVQTQQPTINWKITTQTQSASAAPPQPPHGNKEDARKVKQPEVIL
jgi:hypothetical protein